MPAALKPQLVAATVFVVFILFILSTQFFDVETKWRVLGLGHDGFMVGESGFPYQKPDPLPWHPPSPKYSDSTAPATADLPKRVIVLAKLEQDEVPWAGDEVPGWQHQILTLDGESARLHFGAKRPDKGRVADAYLTYLIENYYNLPETMVFLNGNPTNHDSEPNYNKVEAVENLHINFIQNTGFANLRCESKAGCMANHLSTKHPSDELRTLEATMPNVWKEIFGNEDVPEKLASPCCSEFAVSRAQVQKRSVKEYLKYWEWLNKTIMDDDSSGRVFEYLWHVIFGKVPENCPELQICECNVFGRC